MLSVRTWFSVATAAALAMSCAGESSIEVEEYVGDSTTQPIVNGTLASGYPEAALVDMGSAACSGSLIAPRVVLTAGHCVDGMRTWTVKLPFANNQSAKAKGAVVYDYRNNRDYVNPNQHDVGLILLSTSLSLDAWPVIAQSPLADGAKAINIGRIQNGRFSSSALYQSQPVTLRSARSKGYPYDYYSAEVIESGDSGGPVVAASSSPHSIVAVNSGGGSGTQVLARTDLVYSWIDQQVKANSGWGTNSGTNSSSSGGSGSSSSGGSSSSSGGGSSSSGGEACAGEVEPNDSYTGPNPLGAAVCGSLSSSDTQDWYSWSISGTAPYSLELSPTGDAEVVMWKLVNGRYSQVANTTPTSSAHTSTGSGSYIVVVWSPSGNAQSYKLTLTK
jgi:V8-like Glu-specific endopeptidase